jgi:hypothetical protein
MLPVLYNAFDMDKEGHSVFLSIAGFIIKIHFGASIYLYGKPSLQELKKAIFLYNEGFILKTPQKKYDFLVEFVEKGPYIYHYNKKKTKIQTEVYEIINKKKIVANTHISRFQFIYILKYAINILIVNDGFILHGSANLINRKAIVYIGPSGAGKSTIVGLLKNKYSILSDDECYIRNEKGVFYYYQGPFVEKKYNFAKTPQRYLLSSIFILHKAERCEIKRSSHTGEVISQLANQVWIRKDMQKALTNLSKLIAKIPRYDLFFPKKAAEVFRCISQFNI